MKKIAIIGFGRFGQLLADMAKASFDIVIIEVDAAKARLAAEKGFHTGDISQVASADIVFLAVPISSIEATLQALHPHVNEKHLVADLCSVKTYPVERMQQYLLKSQILGLHPMFGPDSAKTGLQGLQVAFCPVRISEENSRLIRDFWQSHGLEVVETNPRDHDRDAAFSQGFTYSIARIINHTEMPEDLTFSTKSFKAITTVATLSAKDSEQLFHDMMFYNPFFSHMKRQLSKAARETLTNLDAIEAEKPEFKLNT